MPSKSTEEPKLKLPAGHPQGTYVSPDLSFSDGAGLLSDEQQAWADERDAAREEEAKRAAEHEDKVAKEELKAAEGQPTEEPPPKAETKSSG